MKRNGFVYEKAVLRRSTCGTCVTRVPTVGVGISSVLSRVVWLNGVATSLAGRCTDIRYGTSNSLAGIYCYFSGMSSRPLRYPLDSPAED